MQPIACPSQAAADGPERTVAEHLLTVVETFVQAQQRRIDADYNFRKDVDEAEMLTQLETVTQAFKSWNLIRDEPAAQSYLLSLLGNKERREKKPTPPKTGSRRSKRRRPFNPPP